jgi:hypothetical protein
MSTLVRAGIFVGVDKAGDLTPLKDAAAGAKRIYEWALTQGITDPSHAKLLTDGGGRKVTPDLIYDAIAAILNGAGVDQLILYFAGHGVNIARSERWLLSDAPARSNAAVNVSGTVELARYSGIPHVVLISDACRTAAEGIQAQGVTGSEVFPNETRSERAKPVDQFYACLLGRPAAEIKDPKQAAASYSALYTEALLEALQGNPSDLFEADAPPDTALYLRPRKLEEYLEAELPRRISARNLASQVNQEPDAIITSERTWLSRIEAASLPKAAPTPRPRLKKLAPEASARATIVAGDSIGKDTGFPWGDLDLGDLYRSRSKDIHSFSRTVVRLRESFGPDHMETQCGIKVRGATIVEAFAARARAQIGQQRDVVFVDRIAGRAANVLLRFEDGTGTVIPALHEFLTALTFDDGELTDVSYEPSENSWRWNDYQSRASELRALRALAASASQHGRFDLDGDNAATIARRMQVVKGVDPTLAIYAAYAYHDLQMTGRIQEMMEFMLGDLSVTFFDVALLARRLVDKGIGHLPITGIAPLLSQGWALLNANRVKLPPALDGIQRFMRDSLWSLFDAEGVDRLKQALQSGG